MTKDNHQSTHKATARQEQDNERELKDCPFCKAPLVKSVGKDLREEFPDDILWFHKYNEDEPDERKHCIASRIGGIREKHLYLWNTRPDNEPIKRSDRLTDELSNEPNSEIKRLTDKPSEGFMYVSHRLAELETLKVDYEELKQELEEQKKYTDYWNERCSLNIKKNEYNLAEVERLKSELENIKLGIVGVREIASRLNKFNKGSNYYEVTGCIVELVKFVNSCQPQTSPKEVNNNV